MGQMTITAYTDENFSSEYKSALELPINPDKVKFTKGIQYAEDKQLGSLNGSNVYARYRPETLYFECLLDMTNALDDDREKKPVHDVVNDWNNASIAIIVKGIVHRSSRCSTVTFFFSGNSRRSKRNILCSTWMVYLSALN